MSLTVKKLILMNKEQADSLLGRFFTEHGIEIHNEYINSEEYLFAVDDACPEILNLPRLQTIEKLKPELQSNVRCRLNQDMMMATLGKKLFETYFNETKDFNIVERFSAEMKKVINFKIHEALNIGYFVDSIIIEAYKAKFDIVKLRNYLNKAFMYSIERNEANDDDLPISVSYSHDSDAFAVQVIVNTQNFDEKEEMNFFTEELCKLCNFLDIAYMPKRKHLAISAVTFKRENLKNANAYIFSEIGAREPGSLLDNVELISGLKFNPIIEYKVEHEDTQTDKFTLAGQVAEFIFNFRDTEKEAKSLEELNITDIENYLDYYPIKINSKIMDLDLKEFILDLVKNKALLETISLYTKKFSTSIEQALKSDQSNNKDIESNSRVSGGELEKESVTIVKGGLVEKETKTIIKGGGTENNVADELRIIKGSTQELPEQISVIKGSQEDLNADKNEKFVVSDSGSLSNPSPHLTVKNLPMQADEEESFTVKSGLDNNHSKEEVQTIKSREMNLEAFSHIKDKLDIQVSKMKAVMESMKNEIAKLRSELKQKDEALLQVNIASVIPEVLTQENKNDGKKYNIESKENAMLKNSLVKAIEVIKLKDKQLEKSKIDFDMANLAKDLKTRGLEEKIELLKIDLSRAKEAGGLDKLKDLENENKILLSRLELAKGKVSTMSENLDFKENVELERREREIEVLKTGLGVAQSTIEKLRSEKIDLELRMSIDRDLLNKYREEKDNVSGNPKQKMEMVEKDNLIHSLTLEKRTAEDKFKQVSMELKKTEQRLKFAISQLEASTKKKDGTGVAAQKSADAYAKQLDSANMRLSEAASEITEKKKEILKLKQENSLISLKLSELEKKIASLEKKAA